MNRPLTCLAACALALLSAHEASAAALELGYFIAAPDAIATYESAPDLLAGQPGWLEQGMRTEQVGGDGGIADIWTASGLGGVGRSWYPDAGDDGYTRLTRALGERFGSVSLFAGSGWLDDDGPQQIVFQLLDDGALVLEGTLAAPFTGGVFGFTGGDFDEIRLRAYRGPLAGFDSCPPVPGARCNYLWIDQVRRSDDPGLLPAPPSAALAALALAALAVQRRRPARPQAERGGTMA